MLNITCFVMLEPREKSMEMERQNYKMHADVEDICYRKNPKKSWLKFELLGPEKTTALLGRWQSESWRWLRSCHLGILGLIRVITENWNIGES